MNKLFTYDSKRNVIREKPGMEKPEGRVSRPRREYEQHIASLKEYPASGFEAQERRRNEDDQGEGAGNKNI